MTGKTEILWEGAATVSSGNLDISCSFDFAKYQAYEFTFSNGYCQKIYRYGTVASGVAMINLEYGAGGGFTLYATRFSITQGKISIHNSRMIDVYPDNYFDCPGTQSTLISVRGIN